MSKEEIFSAYVLPAVVEPSRSSAKARARITVVLLMAMGPV